MSATSWSICKEGTYRMIYDTQCKDIWHSVQRIDLFLQITINHHITSGVYSYADDSLTTLLLAFTWPPDYCIFYGNNDLSWLRKTGYGIIILVWSYWTSWKFTPTSAGEFRSVNFQKWIQDGWMMSNKYSYYAHEGRFHWCYTLLQQF